MIGFFFARLILLRRPLPFGVAVGFPRIGRKRDGRQQGVQVENVTLQCCTAARFMQVYISIPKAGIPEAGQSMAWSTSARPTAKRAPEIDHSYPQLETLETDLEFKASVVDSYERIKS
jgi:hypothetical protein